MKELKTMMVLLLSLLMLAGCALTAEQKAARAAEEARYRRALEIHLTMQCDPQAAEIMRDIDAARAAADVAALEKLSKRYQDKTQDPLFRNCYRMAWENYMNQRRLDAMERREAVREMNEWMMWQRPLFCRDVLINGRVYRRCD